MLTTNGKGVAVRLTQIMLSKGFGGAERAFVDTVLVLSDAGHEVQAICHPQFKEIGQLERDRKVRLDPVRAGGDWDILATGRIRAHLRAFAPAVAHAHLRRAAWLGCRAARALIPAIATLHNFGDVRRYRHALRLVVTTRAQAEHASKGGLPASRIALIPNFSRLPPAPISAGQAERPKQLLSYGRFVHKKGFDLLLRALRLVTDAGYDLQLRLGGDGPLAKELRQLARTLAVADRVVFTGWLDDVVRELDAAEIFVLPSRAEPFGIVMLEAMARGVPIVTTRTGGPAEVLDAASCFFADCESAESLAEALIAACRAPAERRRHAARAQELYTERYSTAAFLPAITTLYESLAATA